MGIAFADQRRDGRIAGIAAVPVCLSIDFDRLVHRGKTGRGKQHVRSDLAITEDASATGAHLRGGDEQLDRRAGEPVEIDALGQNVAQRIEAPGLRS